MSVTDVVEKDLPALRNGLRPRPARRPRPDPRLIVVTARQPDAAAAASKGNSGGLVAALMPAMEGSNATWIAGKPMQDAGRQARAPGGAAALPYRSVAVRYPGNLHEGFYGGVSNSVLWPLYHSMPHDLSRCGATDWRDYCLVNRYYATVAAEQSTPGSLVWVHDYQLSLVPALLREMTQGTTKIGFFLHTPFPGYDMFRTLPWAREILHGMLAADVIGFHTDDYRRNFCDCVGRLLGIPCAPDAAEIRVDGRLVKLRTIPVGIDVDTLYELAQDPWVRRSAARIKQKLGGERLILGVDRMDYTKGIDRRVEAMDLLLERHPEWNGRAVYAQIAVPSRVEVAAYQGLRTEIEGLVGGINGRRGREDWVPVKLLCRSYPLRELVAWYLAADVALVTPYRDGMNLVAKEYCAANRGGDGVLVLSELAGAAAELGDALLVNPYHLEGLTESIHRALTMPPEQARSRMQRLNQRIRWCDAHHWADTFLAEAGWGKRF